MDNLKKCLCENNRSFNTLVIVLTSFLVVLTLSGLVGINNKIKEGRYIGQDVMIRNTFTVSDSAEVFAKPDLGLVSFSVKTESNTVNGAMSENTKKMNKVIESVKGMGVEDKDLKTTAFNVYPRYDYNNGKRTLAGYEITQSIDVKVRELDKVGDLISRATDSGANQVGNLSFVVDDEDELREQARAEAIKKARDKAEKIAKSLGVNITGVVNFSEGSQTPRYYDYAFAEGVGGGGPAPSIETGESEIQVNVSITYEIN